MINEVQKLKGKTKSKFHKNISNYYDGMNVKNFGFEKDPFFKNAQSISKIYHEVLLLTIFLQTKPQVKNMNINCYDLYYTVIKNRDKKNNVDDKYENNENVYINSNDIINCNHYNGRKKDNSILM